MRYKDIETMRQVRLMIRDIIVPAIVGLYLIDKMNPNLKYQVINKVRNKVDEFKSKLEATRNVETQRN